MADIITLLHANYMLFDISRLKYPLAFLVIAFSVADLCLTQTILSATSSHSEGNPFIAPFVMSWWAWPIRVGIPLLAVTRDLRRDNHELLLFAACLYGTIVAWNLSVFLGWTL